LFRSDWGIPSCLRQLTLTLNAGGASVPDGRFWRVWGTLPRAGSTNYEAEEGARGSAAARQSNCHRVAKVAGPSGIEEKYPKKFRSPNRKRVVGSTGKKLLFAECEPIRALARRSERSIEPDA
jgi:hypothetical protein